MVSGYQNGIIAQLLQAIIGQINFDGEPISNIGDILLSILEHTPYDDEPKSVLAELFLKLKAKLENEPFEPYDKEPTSAIAEILLSILNVTPYEKEPNSRIAELLLELKAELESYVELTASGSICNFTTSLALPLVSVKSAIVATGGGGTPSSPIAINGFNQAVISHSGEDMTNPTIYTLALGQTVYGGEVDVTNGKVKITHKGITDLSQLNWQYQTAYSRFITTDLNSEIKRTIDNNEILNGLLCSIYETSSANRTASSSYDNITGASSTGLLSLRDTSLNGDLTALTARLTNQVLVYPLATPIEIDITPQEITALVGVNNLWSDTGDSEVTYLAEISDNIEQTSKARAAVKAEKELKAKLEKELKELEEKETIKEPIKEIGETKK